MRRLAARSRGPLALARIGFSELDSPVMARVKNRCIFARRQALRLAKFLLTRPPLLGALLIAELT